MNLDFPLKFHQASSFKQFLVIACMLKLVLVLVWLAWIGGVEFSFDGIFTAPLTYISDIRIPFMAQNNTYTVAESHAWKCLLPYKDPWNAEMLPYVNPLEPGPMKECLYPLDDYNIRMGGWNDVKDTVRPECDVFEVHCKKKDGKDSPVHNNVYYQIYRPPEGAKPQNIRNFISSTTPPPNSSISEGKLNHKGFSAHVIVLDSVSHSNFLRTMQRTVYLLREEFDAIPFHHLNKVGHNSMPNAFAFLFGKQMEPMLKSPLNDETVPPDSGYDRPSVCASFLDNEKSFIPFQFKQAGYKTMMAEDWALGALNWYDCRGFGKTPTDHYMSIDLFNSGYRTKFTRPSRRNDIANLTHDRQNQLYHADAEFYRTLRKLGPKLEDSFLFVMGDHGLRYGDARSTSTGSMEDNNPALFVVLPKALRKNRELRTIMEKNSRQLISQHDIYASLLSIVKESHLWNTSEWDPLWPKSDQISALPYMHGSSLFHFPMKQPRDCPNLRIPFSYCQCEQKFTEIVTEANLETKKLVIMLAQASVDKLNSDIAELHYEEKCEQLILDDCQDCKVKLSRLELENVHQDASVITNTYKIMFQTKPGGGKFAIFLRTTQNSDENADKSKNINGDVKIDFISDEFERLNEYGSQSKCALGHHKVRPLCYCKDQEEKVKK
ncbi:hypothetical protein Ddc_07378 [Ditylenchus destructor]|nr:hypothetical protein Ddc_07378 [Ditylenchus destructor]